MDMFFTRTAGTASCRRMPRRYRRMGARRLREWLFSASAVFLSFFFPVRHAMAEAPQWRQDGQAKGGISRSHRAERIGQIEYVVAKVVVADEIVKYSAAGKPADAQREDDGSLTAAVMVSRSRLYMDEIIVEGAPAISPPPEEGDPIVSVPADKAPTLEVESSSASSSSSIASGPASSPFLTASTVLFANNPRIAEVGERIGRLFGDSALSGGVALTGYQSDAAHAQIVPGTSRAGSTAVWAAPSFQYTDQSDKIKYDLYTTALSVGVDRWLSDCAFLGLALGGSTSRFDSKAGDVDIDDLGVSLYGGLYLPASVELGGFLSYGRAWFSDQESGGTRYDDYHANSYALGLEVGRRFSVGQELIFRPFAAYDVQYARFGDFAMRMDPSDAFRETYDSHSETLHRFRFGLEFQRRFAERFALGAKAYYIGLAGDRAATTRFSFSNPGSGYHFSSIQRGDALDRHAGALDLDLLIRLSARASLGVGYGLKAGENHVSHRAGLNFTISF